MTLDQGLIERVIRKAVRDPALAKLLDELPQGDPDAPMAEVWIPLCTTRHRVPIGVTCHLDFGEWHGPTTEPADVRVFARIEGIGQRSAPLVSRRLADDVLVVPGANVTCSVCVRV